MINHDRKEAAKQLAEILGIPVYIVPPNPIRPPAAFLNEGEPFLEPGQAYGDLSMNLSMTLIAPVSADQEIQVAALDGYIDQLHQSDLREQVTAVSGYQTLPGSDTQPYLATEVAMTFTIRED